VRPRFKSEVVSWNSREKSDITATLDSGSYLARRDLDGSWTGLGHDLYRTWTGLGQDLDGT
jgi:hypothetical protein